MTDHLPSNQPGELVRLLRQRYEDEGDTISRKAADEIERLRAERDEWKRGSEVVNARLLAEVERLTDVLRRNGFRECDIPACNCGSWHHVGGFAERFREIDEATADDERNGETLLTRIGRIVADRERLRAAARALFAKLDCWCNYSQQCEVCKLELAIDGIAGVAPEPGVAYPRGWCAQHGYWVELEGDRAGCPKCRAAETPAERKT